MKAKNMILRSLETERLEFDSLKNGLQRLQKKIRADELPSVLTEEEVRIVSEQTSRLISLIYMCQVDLEAAIDDVKKNC